MTFVHQEMIHGVVQSDVTKGTSDYQHNHPLPKAVANSILPIFEALSDEDRLARCLHGGT